MKGKLTKNISLTDWDRVNKLSDDQIDFSDNPETNEEFWKEAEWYIPPKKVTDPSKVHLSFNVLFY
jgi:hypothetical protein